MLHPSYNDLMNVVNSDVEPGEQPVVNSRYSIVLATAKRARQIIGGSEPLVNGKYPKPLSIAIEELSTSAIKIDSEDNLPDDVEIALPEETQDVEPEELIEAFEEEEGSEEETTEA